jgi:hypothetical protein
MDPVLGPAPAPAGVLVLAPAGMLALAGVLVLALAPD